MKLPQLRMESQLAKIQIQQPTGKQEISQPKAVLTIEQPQAELSIHTTPSKLTIDQSQAWEDMNLMHIMKRNKQFAQEGYNGWLEGMGRRAEQGKELMKIENAGNPIVAQAIQNGHRGTKQLGITFIPTPLSVKFAYQPSEVQISAKTNQPVIKVETNAPVHHYERGSVDISMLQYENLEIDFVNLYV